MSVPTVDQVQNVLAAAFGRTIRVAAVDRIAPWSVLRCRLEPDADASPHPDSVIVKWVRDDPRGFRTDPRQLATEQAALEFLAEIDFPRAPRLVAADRAAGLLVLEDLAPRVALADLIRRQGAETSLPQLLAFAGVMGDLQATTAGKVELYDSKRGSLGSIDRGVGRERGLGPDWPDARRRLEALGQAMAATVAAELGRVVEALLNPGPFLAFSNGDPETNNFLVDGEDGRLIDFEFADYRHGLVSATWMHVPGPGWITVTAPFCADLEARYRRALSVGIPEAEDDRLFGFGMAAACLAIGCDRLSRFATLDARKPGESSRLQMVSTLESAAAVARRHRALPQLSGWVERTAEWLRRRWPDANVDLATYPAYTSRL